MPRRRGIYSTLVVAALIAATLLVPPTAQAAPSQPDPWPWPTICAEGDLAGSASWSDSGMALSMYGSIRPCPGEVASTARYTLVLHFADRAEPARVTMPIYDPESAFALGGARPEPVRAVCLVDSMSAVPDEANVVTARSRACVAIEGGSAAGARTVSPIPITDPGLHPRVQLPVDAWPPEDGIDICASCV